MTILSAAQSACIRLVGRRPQSLFSSTDTMMIEIADLANDVATDIMKSNDWRGLTKLHASAGNGTDTAFTMPADYNRMTLAGDVFNTSWPMQHFTPAGSLDFWRDLLNGAITLASVTPGYWIILDGKFNVWPVLPSGQSAQFYYISKNIVCSNDGGTKPAFTVDSDTFLFDERLITLGLIWRWRAQKRMEYAEDLASYEKALSEIMGREKGANSIRKGPALANVSAGIAWPWPLGGGS